MSAGAVDRQLRADRARLSLRERVAIAIFEAPYGEWWGVANRSERRAARKQADAALALISAGE